MDRILQKAYNAILFVQRLGIRDFLQELKFRVTNYYHELRLGVDTAASDSREDLMPINPELRNYEPTGYKAIYSMLERIALNKSESTFLDYGSGKGRVVIVAATFLFKRIIGIEISDKLLALAKRNISKMRHKRTKNIELCQIDAAQYAVPNDVNIIYFFNPFVGQMLQKVVSNIYDSYKQYPRKICIIFFNNGHFEKVIENLSWITRVYQTCVYPDYPCGIYVTRAQ